MKPVIQDGWVIAGDVDGKPYWGYSQTVLIKSPICIQDVPNDHKVYRARLIIYGEVKQDAAR